MKRNIYTKLWMIFFVLMGAACTNQVEDAIPVSGQPIEFSVQSDWKEIPNTRSNDGKTKFEKGNQIQIFGFHTSSSGAEKKFMYRVGEPARGQIVTFDSINWNYSPKRFWPKEGKLDFYASYPEYSVLNDEDNHRMTYKQTVNPLQLDLLWGIATNRNCSTACKDTVKIWMVHALARVDISFHSSLGKIRQAIVSAYKSGYFLNAKSDGIPDWIVDSFDEKNIQRDTIIPSKGLTTIGDATVFILPDKITGLKLILTNGTVIDASKELQQPQYTFDAGKIYKLTISKGVQKKNTNSRSIAMSVRCVSE